ncbi:N-acetylmuramidase family protein [Moraxella haemolytica]|uniref:N-acetylmuramidase family protein n=1 Tax=Moraxella TaxID=475 RepID=UPI002542E537|nr:N-acetylmuramidase family protein [Moraxella sp. ZY171148]WII94715.1 N-acetylmuramidase family protein [Moraxella sp. ZY171148]
MKLLKYGNKGEQVERLQVKLNENGAKLAVDGDFGRATEKAVMAFQRSAGLAVDGVVGIKTWQALYGEPSIHLLSMADYETAANELGVPVNVVQAFAKVESRGAGFFGVDQPAILFERHVFYRLLKSKYGKNTADTLAQRHPNIISTKTGGYKGGASEYVRLNFAKTIDKDLAYSSASWGMFQVMGENWQVLGYASVDEFVSLMRQGESHHLDAFVRFCKTKKGLLDALQTGDWDKVFTLYNGRAYKKHGYDYKFLRELRRLELISEKA